MPRKNRISDSVDSGGLTELGRRWRRVAIAHEKLIHAYMWDVVRYRLALGQDLEHGTLPTTHDSSAPLHPEPPAAPD